jgi:hypothetical protein
MVRVGATHARPASWGGIILTTGLGTAITGVILFLLFMLASHGALGTGPSTFAPWVADAFKSGQFVEDPYQEGSTKIGSHQWNDCLIAVMAMDQRGDRNRLALSPILMDMGDSPSLSTNPCAVLSALNKGAVPKDDLYYYDRYVHGGVVVLRALAPHMDLKTVRTLYRNVQTALLMLGLAVVLVGLARGVNPPIMAVLGVSIVAFMRYFGLESFSQSLGHGPADIILAAYLLMLAIMALAPVGLGMTILAAAVIGALSIIFELFTGGFQLGLAMAIGLAPLVTRPGPRPAVIATAAAVAFVGAGAIVYLLKMFAVVLIAGQGVATDAAGELLRLTIFSWQGNGLREGGRAFIESLGVLAGGMWLLSAATVLLAAVVGLFGLHRLLTRHPDHAVREQAILLALSSLIMPAWCLGFSNLMILHAWFTDRILVWVIAAGFGLFLLALIPQRTANNASGPATA